MILIYSVGGIYYIEYVYKDNNEPVVKNLAEIEGYPYSLKSNACKLYKDEFNILKDNLENNYNEEEYIKSISKLYIIDLYSLKNKINKYDINVDFIYPDIVSNYRLNIENTLYKYFIWFYIRLLFNYKFIPFLTKIIYFSIISNTFKRNYSKEDITNKS